MSSEKTTHSNAVRRLDVVVVGAGFGGMYAVYKFNQMGLKIQGFEAGSNVGVFGFGTATPAPELICPASTTALVFLMKSSKSGLGQSSLLRNLNCFSTSTLLQTV